SPLGLCASRTQRPLFLARRLFCDIRTAVVPSVRRSSFPLLQSGQTFSPPMSILARLCLAQYGRLAACQLVGVFFSSASSISAASSFREFSQHRQSNRSHMACCRLSRTNYPSSIACLLLAVARCGNSRRRSFRAPHAQVPAASRNIYPPWFCRCG